MRKLAAFIGAVGLCAFGATGAAFASSGSVSPSTNLTDGQVVTVTYNGLVPNQQGFAYECVKPTTDPTFSYPGDCYTTTETKPFLSSTGAGTFQFKVAEGAEPVNLAFACGALKPGDDPSTPIVNPCFVRVTDTTPTNTGNQFSVPIFFATTTPVPEAPLSILLPLGAFGVLGGAYFVVRNRRRSSHTAAA